MFEKVLIANRGEIAIRIARTCRRLGLAVATVHSDADRDALHVRDIGESVRLGPAPARDSYLAIDRVVQAARAVGADAVHPGYGFLAENADFADALQRAGIAFVGPTPQVLRDFGDKAAAKRIAAAAGVPTIPGSPGASADAREVAEMARSLGFPVLLKAAAGGGGKGIRVLHAEHDLADAIAAAMREGAGAFGDPSLLVERYLPHGRHVEVQILGDAQGRVLHLWERECSLQRRHQKVVEEAPALPLPAGLRARMLEAAVALGRAVRYRALGTVEFLVAGDAFHFLEVNPRLQVEHPVTEAVTGLDLVELQLRAAAGEPLPITQGDVRCDGHAVEVRVYAEDPAHGFLPSTGTLHRLQLPHDCARV
ncbi:MAG TPA: biotin carboxylase N-terminal domain-containing protein, partial [Burkholderiaceae bacterium]|nr:biotin carboxylase N-terminal domain-containing protein [Burkholderiaceae bacterium]